MNCWKAFRLQVILFDYIVNVMCYVWTMCNQTWADAFRGEPYLKEFVAVYEELKEKGCEFPMTDLDNIPPIHTPARVMSAPVSCTLG